MQVLRRLLAAHRIAKRPAVFCCTARLTATGSRVLLASTSSHPLLAHSRNASTEGDKSKIPKGPVWTAADAGDAQAISAALASGGSTEEADVVSTGLVHLVRCLLY